jgi:hypothetical protein
MKRRSSEDAADADASETPSAGKRARATTATIAEIPTGDDDVRGDSRDARRDARTERARRRDRWPNRDARRGRTRDDDDGRERTNGIAREKRRRRRVRTRSDEGRIGGAREEAVTDDEDEFERGWVEIEREVEPQELADVERRAGGGGGEGERETRGQGEGEGEREGRDERRCARFARFE